MRRDFSGRRVTVMGLGRFGGGVGVARYLVKRGARVTVTDAAKPETLADSVAALAGLPVRFRLGGHDEADFTGCDLLVVGPGVPKNSPYLAAAVGAGVPLSAEMNLFLAECAGRVVGVTGTNGKSTVTAMAGAILRTRFTTWVGGNIGRSLLDDVEHIGPDDRVALEMSSFQLEDLAPAGICPLVSVVTNLTPNHLDRHGSFEEYGRAKKNIFRFHRPHDWLILNADDPVTRTWAGERSGRLAWFSTESPTGAGDLTVRAADGRVLLDGRDAGPLRLAVPGRHNRSNAMAALAAALIEGVPADDALAALAAYRSLPDRLEHVETIDGVAWYNDSIATTPESVFAALGSFEVPRIVIVGGVNKNLDLRPLAAELHRSAKAVVMIGTAGPEIRRLLEDEAGRAGGAGPVLADAGGMGEAVECCAELARPGDVVLMSPACASFDMFTNYRHRGQVFADCVRALAARRAAEPTASAAG